MLEREFSKVYQRMLQNLKPNNVYTHKCVKSKQSEVKAVLTELWRTLHKKKVVQDMSGADSIRDFALLCLQRIYRTFAINET